MSQFLIIAAVALSLCISVDAQFTTRRRRPIRGGGIAGIIVAAVVLLIIGGIFLLVLRRRRSSRVGGRGGVLAPPMSQGPGSGSGGGYPGPAPNITSNVDHEAGYQPPVGGGALPPQSGPGFDHKGPTQPPPTYQTGDKHEGYAPPPGIPPNAENYQPGGEASHNATGHGQADEPFVGGFRKAN